MKNIERTLTPIIKTVSKSFRVLLLNGQRQVGKSTILEDIAKGTERTILSLDNMIYRKMAQEDPELFLQRFPPPILIDEVQYAPQLFPYLKIYTDNHKNKKGAIWLTGSQKFKLMEGIQESLAGRVAILDMFGLSYREKIKQANTAKPFIPNIKTPKNLLPKQNIKTIFKRIWEGTLPEIVLDKKLDRDIYYSSYIRTFIERDVRDFYNVSKPIQFFNFLTLIAAQTGNLLNYSSLAKDIGVDTKTVQTWTGILERAGIIFLLQPYSNNMTTRIVKSPKVYFLDTGLCAYLCKWLTPETLMAGAMNGHIFETYVIGEVLKSYYHNGKEPIMYFYRDSNKNEIDIVLEQDNTLFPIEIKMTSNPGKDDYKAFKYLDNGSKKIGTGAVICLQPEYLPLTKNVVSVPVWEV